MNASQIEKNIIALVENFNKEEFIYDLLLAYGISKTSITRLKRGDFNLSKVEGEVLYKSKMLFKEVETGNLLHTIDELTKDASSLKYNPRFVIVTDYKTLLAKDIRTGQTLDTPILEIAKHFSFFLPWDGQEKYQSTNENYADRKASYEMAKLYDILVKENPSIYEDGGHSLNIFLSRLLFCFFAEDTAIFPVEGMFTDTLEQHTQTDGSDIHTFLNRLFKVLNTEDNSKEASHFSQFPFVNGGLFRNTIKSPKFNKEARKIIINCGDLDWSEINPDIFGSMIQAVVNPAYRSGLGMHYTSVPNIMKVIEPLFLNELYDEFEKYKDNERKLKLLISRLGQLKIFDPACGSGNFLIIAYKELRLLEIKIWQQIDFNRKASKLPYQTETVYTNIKLSQFYGIELDDFAHEMAILSLWLAEHQMNKIFVDELFDFGRSKPILPLKEAGHITQDNATRIEWKNVCPIDLADEVYILGNPPYLGSSMQNTEQKKDMEIVFARYKRFKNLDYITSWFIKGSNYIKGFNSKLAFVTTNSITQGIQVELLWPNIFNGGIEIGFAHQSFKWTNNAKGNAGVTVVIIGLQNKSNNLKPIFNLGLKSKVPNINGYLQAGENLFISKKSNPISKLPKMISGNKPVDGGNLILNENEKNKFISNNPNSYNYIKKFIGASEFLNNTCRYCLWIEDEDLKEAKKIDDISNRIKETKEFRLKSRDVGAQNLASKAHQFRDFFFSINSTILIPQTTSERREYIPIGYLSPDFIISNGARAIFDAEPWIFGLLSSKIHNVWIQAVAGRLETRIQYSNTLCYNTFPFPEINKKQKEQINLHVFEVLEEREKHPEKTLAQLYDPDKMPKGLKEVHHQLDLAIERCYRLKPFTSDTERLEYLFKEYEKMINKNTLLEKPKRTRKKKI
ncbi:DNA methyltransferase [uncultured Lutibacter sp.]|uniref:class I SAM-dependent DNA methyltransferase n=1 Tax=uncultured Lutibacter sp. TaxID=437739 RepID=UPI002601A038|nr:DNA methyltransferase [uncultured Lutibacter sp.]